MAISFGRRSSGGSSSGGGGGGGSVTLASITGTLATTKGGTGLHATDIADLRDKLGIGAGGSGSAGGTGLDALPYILNANTQSDDTIARSDGATVNRPTGMTEGVMIRLGDNQLALQVADGKQWSRALASTLDTAWSTPAAPSPAVTTLTTESQFRALADGAIGKTSANVWLPAFNDGSKPAEVIVARRGDYLLAFDRYNAFWAPRPLAATWTEIPWRWAPEYPFPIDGVFIEGNNSTETAIPPGDVAIIWGDAGIEDGNSAVHVLVKHAINAAHTTSTFTAWFLTESGAIRQATRSRAYTSGNWARVAADEFTDGAVDAAAIDDSIITIDRGSSEPVFHGKVPEISSLEFPGYTLTAASPSAPGQVFWNVSARTLYVIHQAQDVHLTDLFHPDFEVELHKDSTNFVRGVFSSVVTVPGGSNVTGAIFRSEDLTTTGTINTGDTITIKGHKSVVTKTDRILPINLGLSHGASVANRHITMNSTGSGFAATAGALLPASAGIGAAPTKTGSYTVAAAATGDGQITFGSGSILINDSPQEGATITNMIAQSLQHNKHLMFIKDASNYIGIFSTATTAASGNHTIAYSDELSIRVGTIATGDTVTISVRPVDSDEHISHDFLGRNIIVAPPSSHLIWAQQGNTGITVNNNGDSWTDLNFETRAWQIRAPHFPLHGTIATLSLSTVVNCGSGNLEAIGIEARIQARTATTIPGLATATYTDVAAPSGPRFTDNNEPGLIFRSKVAAGQASGDRFRDYFVNVSMGFPLSRLPTGAADNRYVQFRPSIRKSASSFENIGSIYGGTLLITMFGPAAVTA